jgi:hypothetical protein
VPQLHSCFFGRIHGRSTRTNKVQGCALLSCSLGTALASQILADDQIPHCTCFYCSLDGRFLTPSRLPAPASTSALTNLMVSLQLEETGGKELKGRQLAVVDFQCSVEAQATARGATVAREISYFMMVVRGDGNERGKYGPPAPNFLLPAYTTHFICHYLCSFAPVPCYKLSLCMQTR